VNGDGTIDYEEFLAATINMGKLQREENLKTAFEHFDLDGNGQISHDELVQVGGRGVGVCARGAAVCMRVCMLSQVWRGARWHAPCKFALELSSRLALHLAQVPGLAAGVGPSGGDWVTLYP